MNGTYLLRDIPCGFSTNYLVISFHLLRENPPLSPRFEILIKSWERTPRNSNWILWVASYWNLWRLSAGEAFSIPFMSGIRIIRINGHQSDSAVKVGVGNPFPSFNLMDLFTSYTWIVFKVSWKKKLFLLVSVKCVAIEGEFLVQSKASLQPLRLFSNTKKLFWIYLNKLHFWIHFCSETHKRVRCSDSEIASSNGCCWKPAVW